MILYGLLIKCTIVAKSVVVGVGGGGGNKKGGAVIPKISIYFFSNNFVYKCCTHGKYSYTWYYSHVQ